MRAALAIVVALAGLGQPAAPAGADGPGRPLPSAAAGRCPNLPAQPLPAGALAGATRAALEQAPALYGGTRLDGMRATEAILARRDDPGRGGYARVTCGRRLQDRTVVVHLDFPAMRPSASLSQGVVLVSRFGGRYRVWAVLH
ncbi:MAG: hypothetical protein QOI62_3796 [Solirubrobacteraceae bacterium]|nr:hypothetical protein [Solirubrobacteraceae bacterium]MEA2360536.1 hypothetical protein [Solirubrobacteraceae bacterium]